LQSGPIWWGIAVVIIGGNTALFGVLHAFGKTDQKRMLAYSSIENMGLMFMGSGIAMIFITKGQPLLASIALIAVLYHLANHALFKSLLFMGAGAVLMVSHTKNMNLLGGLIRRMPWTALFMLVGSLSIAALPPMNGFVSEWMLFQSIFTLGFFGNSIAMHLFGALIMAVLAMVGALVAFLFIRFFSMTFLALPRSDMAEQAYEVPVSMLIGMGLLSIGCILLGVFPFTMFGVIHKTIQALIGISAIPSLTITPATVNSGISKISIGTTGIMIIFGVLFAWGVTKFIGRKTRTIREETWTCGNTLVPRMTYTASGFSKPLRVSFRLLMKPSRSLIADRNPRNPFFVRGYTYVSQIPLIIEDILYKPVMKFLVTGANIFRKIQNGIVQSYLLYLLATLVFMLIWVMGR
jgi:hydrogenase-4 component B